MFFSQYILSKKGALSRVWLAAHWEGKLSKLQVLDTDVVQSVDSIQSPEVPFALRMSGHLLLGVVRIYSRKVKYLLGDAQDALVKIKMAFRTGVVDLPENATVAKVNAITLPEQDLNEFELALDDDFDLEDMPGFESVVDFHKARRREITMADESDIENALGGDQDGFPDAFGAELGDTPEALRAGTPAGTGDGAGVDFLASEQMSAFGQEAEGFGEGGFDVQDNFEATPMDGGLGPDGSRRTSALLTSALGSKGLQLLDMQPEDFLMPDSAGGAGALDGTTPAPAFAALDPETPANATTVKPTKKRKFSSRDQSTELSSPSIRAQLENTKPIVAEPELAPPTKRAMYKRNVELKTAKERLQMAPTTGLCPQLAGLYSHNINAALSGDVDDEEGALEADALGADLMGGNASDNPEFGAEDDTNIAFGDGFEQYGDDEMPSTQQLLDDDFGGDAPMEDGGFGDNIDGPGPEYYESDDEAAGDGGDEADAADAQARSWSLHTQKMHKFLERSFEAKKTDQLSFFDMADGKRRKTVSASFFELLVLKTRGYIDVAQDQPYADIMVAKSNKFHRAVKEEARHEVAV